MKRLLLFLALFGGGLAGLLWLDARDAATSGSGTERPPTRDVEPGDLVEVPAQPSDPGVGATAAPVTAQGPTAGAQDPEPPVLFGASGRLRYSRTPEEGGAALYVLEARDTRTREDDWMDLVDVEVRLAGRGTLTATSGELELLRSGGLLGPQPGDVVRLVEPRFTLDPAHPLAPAELTAGAAEANLGAGALQMTGAPRLRSTSWDLDGGRLDAQLAPLDLRAADGARLVVRDGLGVEVLTLRAATVQLVDTTTPEVAAAGGGSFRLSGLGDADEPARLTLAGARPLELDAPGVTLLGHRVPSGELVVDAIDVTGRGTLLLPEGSAAGEDFRFDLDGAGRLQRVTLTGGPRLEADLGGGAAAGARLPAGPVTLASEAPIVVDLTSDFAFSTAGPATVSWGAARLTSTGRVTGRLPAGEDRASLVFDGEVRLDDGAERPTRFTAHAVDLDVREAPGAEGAARFSATVRTTGPAALVGPARRDGETLDVRAGGALTAHLQGEAWRVERAEDLTLTLAGGREVVFRADLLRDLDPIAQHMDLSGSIRLDSGDAHAEGERLVLAGEDYLLLEGRPGAPASYTAHDLAVRADGLLREGDRFVARGSVGARLGVEDERLEVACESFELRGVAGELDALALPRDQTLEVSGAVDATASVGGESFALRCAAMTVHQRPLADPTGAGSTRRAVDLLARGGIELRWLRTQEDWRVQAERLDLFAEETAGEPLVELVAREAVTVRELGGEFLGEGALLHIDRGPTEQGERARLEGGEGPALVQGLLPRSLLANAATAAPGAPEDAATGEPDPAPARYRGSVDWLEYGDERLRAARLDLELEGLTLPGAAGNRPAETPARLTCDGLVATAEELQLDGTVRLTGRDAENVPIRFHSDFATLYRLQSASVAGDADAPARPQVLAHGNVLLRRGAAFEVYGEDLVVHQGGELLRIEGLPASASYAGLLVRAPWLAFDPVNMTFEKGPGWISVDPALLRLLGGRPAEDGDPEEAPDAPSGEERP